MSKNNGTGIDPDAVLRVDRLLGNREKKTNTKSNVTNKIDNNWNINVPEKPKKKQFTQVRVEDSIIKGFKEYIFNERIDLAYTKVMNEVLKKFLIENNIDF